MLQTFVSFLEHDKLSSYLTAFIFVLFYHLPILFQPNALDLSLISFILSPGWFFSPSLSQLPETIPIPLLTQTCDVLCLLSTHPWYGK